MFKLKLNLYVFVFNALLAIGLCYIYAPPLTIPHYIDTVFMLILVYAMLALASITVRGGFYDGVTYGFRRFRHKLSRNKDYLDNLESKPMPSEKVKQSVYHIFLFQCAALLGMMAILILI